MLRGKKLKDFAGKNEKTKIIAKIQKVRRQSKSVITVSFPIEDRSFLNAL